MLYRCSGWYLSRCPRSISWPSRAFLKAPAPNEVRPATLQTPFKGTLIDGESYKELVKEHYKAYPILYMDLKVRSDLTTC
jgi:hypothetical protein